MFFVFRIFGLCWLVLLLNTSCVCPSTFLLPGKMTLIIHLLSILSLVNLVTSEHLTFLSSQVSIYQVFCFCLFVLTGLSADLETLKILEKP